MSTQSMLGVDILLLTIFLYYCSNEFTNPLQDIQSLMGLCRRHRNAYTYHIQAF